MPRFIRGVIFFTFIFLFSISAVGVLFYAGGYRYHWEKHIIEKTGQFVFETKPKGATVTLSGKQYRTPTHIPYLLSGEYWVEVAKDGYHSWKERLTIIPGRSTIVSDLVLLKNEPSRELFREKSIQHLTIGDNERIFFIVKDTLMYYDTRSHDHGILYQAEEPILSFQLSPSGKRFFIHMQKKSVFLEERSAGIKTFDLTFFKQPIQKSGWTHTNQFILGTNKGIYRIDYPQKHAELVYAYPYSDFFTADKLYIIAGTLEKKLFVLDPQNAESLYDVGALPRDSFSFEETHESFLAIRNTRGGTYLFDRSDLRKGYIAIEGVSNFSWGRENSFIAWNDFEVWRYTIKGSEVKKELLTRQSEPIRDGIFHEDISQMFFISGKGDVTALETREGRERNRVSLERFSTLQTLIMGSDKKTLYGVGDKNGTSGIFAISFIE